MANVTASRGCGADRLSSVSDDIVRLLERPDAYPDATTSVEAIETHISWVFLTDRFAYKLKKAVRFDFLDFSTPELRRRACACEVELNRRLAPNVYLGVVPVVRTAKGRLAVQGQGTPVDWLVKMRRLPANAALDVLIRDGRIGRGAIDQLARTLSAFYQNLPPVTLTIENYRRSLERHVLANRAELEARAHHLDLPTVRRLHAAQLRVLRLTPDLLDDRVRNGRIVEGHGDLRPEHIYFTPAPVVIDGIEFNREYRTLDVADELAFLAMECDFLGAHGIAEPIIDRYAEESADRPPRPLLDFYRLYRACVRAKVCALRAEQLGGAPRSRWLESAGRYLELAHRYTGSLGPPLLVLVRGLPGAGKSTIAEMLSEQLGIDLLQTDVVRKIMFGPTDEQLGFNAGRYLPENRMRVYDEMHRRAAELLRSGRSVVLDGTYPAAGLRADAALLAERYQAAFLPVHCQCPHEIARQRIAARLLEGGTASDTRPEFLDRQRQAEEPDSPDHASLAVDTSSSTVEPMRDVLAAIRDICFGGVPVTADRRGSFA